MAKSYAVNIVTSSLGLALCSKFDSRTQNAAEVLLSTVCNFLMHQHKYEA